MTKSWDIERLDQVAEVVGRGIAPKYDDDGDFLVVNQRCIRDGRVSLDNARRHNSGARKVKADKVLNVGDVLVNSTGVGTLGRTAPLREVQSSITADSHVTILRPLPDVSSQWFAYAVSALEPEIENLAEGSTGQTELSRHRLADLELTVPPLSEQRAIAATLGALDDKIESNRRAMALLSNLFSTRFSHLLESSRSTSYQPLSEIATITKGRSYKSAELTESSVALVTLKSIDRNGGYKHDGLKPYIGPYKPEQVVAPGEIVVAQTDLTQGAEVVGRGVRVPSSEAHSILVASLDLAILRPKNEMPIEYLLGLLSGDSFRQHCRNHVTGTTVLHLAKDAMPTWTAPIVSAKEQESFSAVARELLARVDAFSTENQRLTDLRDALLPELLSGRIRAADVEITP